MIVNSHLMEFGYELLSSYPYAYNRFLKGQLDGTISGIDTKCLYFFSPNHTEVVDKKRAFLNIHSAKHDGIPNTIIHRAELDWDVWNPPPLKQHYKDKAITFEKPTVCLCNRYTKEWGRPPINYFNLDVLKRLFDLLKDRYQIVYVSVAGRTEYYDHHEEVELGDYDFIYQNYDGSEVKIIHDISEDYEISYNETVLRVFAGCDKFITMNGGLGILASYFGGENMIYSKETQELRPDVNSFKRWYPRLGGSYINHVDTYDKLLSLVNMTWIADVRMKTYFFINTHDPIATKKQVQAAIMNNPYGTVVVYASCLLIMKRLIKEKCIVIPRYVKKKENIVLTQEEIDPYCNNGNYEVTDVHAKKTFLKSGNVSHVITSPLAKKYVKINDYGYSDIIPS